MSEDQASPEIEKVESAGEVLREARKKYGLSEEDVAAELNLSVHQIRALEDDKNQELPGETYTRGYLKSYARLLNADESRVLKDFSQQANTAITGIHPVIRETRSGDRHMKLLSLAVIAVLSGLMFIWWQGRDESNVVALNAADSVEDGSAVVVDAPDASSSEAAPGVDLSVSDQQPAQVAEASNIDAGDDPSGSRPRQDSPPVAVQSGAGHEVAADSDTGEPGVGQPASASPVESLDPQPAAQLEDQTTTESVAGSGGRSEQATAVQVATVTAGTGGGSNPDGAAEIQAEPVDSGQEVKLTFTVASWVDLRDAEGRRLLYKNVNQGQEVSVRGQPPFSVFLGNAEGVQIEYQGQPFDFTAFTNGIYARFELGVTRAN